MSDPVQPQQQMAEPFQTSMLNVGQHLKNIFADNRLARKATVKEFLTVQTEGELVATAVVNNFFTIATDRKRPNSPKQ